MNYFEILRQYRERVDSDIADLSGTAQGMVDNTASAFLGESLLQNEPITTARSAMDALYSAVLQHQRDIQALQSEATAMGASGTSVNVDFADYADGPMPSLFTITYNGSGTSVLGVASGKAAWSTLVNDADRGAHVIYNVAPTNTDFQVVRGTMASPPQPAGNSGGTPRIWALARVDDPANPQNYVFARGYAAGLLTYRADIGCVVSGVETVWESNIPLTWSLDMRFHAGVGSTARQYELYSGSTLVRQITEPGTSSHLGSGYRYWGSRTEMKYSDNGARQPGKISGSSVTDSALPTTVGSFARIYRTSTSNVSFTGDAVLASNFFSVIAEQSPDITPDLTAGKFTVSQDGTYRVTAAIKTPASGWPNRASLRIYKNGSADVFISGTWARGNTSLGGNQNPDRVHGSGSIYLVAGDYVQIGMVADTGSGNLTGEATGKETYAEIALENRSLV